MKEKSKLPANGSKINSKSEKIRKGKLLVILYILLFSIPAQIFITGIILKNNAFDEAKFYLDSYYKHQDNELVALHLIERIADKAGSESSVLDSASFIELLKKHIVHHTNDRYIMFYKYLLGHEYLKLGHEHYAYFYFHNLVENFDFSTLYRVNAKIKKMLFSSLLYLVSFDNNPFFAIHYNSLLVKHFKYELENPGNNYYLLGKSYDEIGDWNNAYASYRSLFLYPEHTLMQETYEERESIFLRLKRRGQKSVIWSDAEEARKAVLYALFSHKNSYIRRLRSPIFFTANWNESLIDPNTSVPNFDITAVLARSNISVTNRFSAFSTDSSKLWKTSGWGRVPIWYFVFNKIVQPDTPDINGTWEWAGIYFGVGNEKYIPTL